MKKVIFASAFLLAGTLAMAQNKQEKPAAKKAETTTKATTAKSTSKVAPATYKEIPIGIEKKHYPMKKKKETPAKKPA